MSKPTDAASILATLQGMQNQAPQQPSPFSESQAQAAWSPPAAPAPAPTIPGFGQAVNPPPNPFGVAAQAPQAPQAPNIGAAPQSSAGLSARLEETPEPAPAPAPPPAAKKSRKKAEPEPALSETAEKLLAEYVQDTLATNAKIRLACDALAYIATKMG